MWLKALFLQQTNQPKSMIFTAQIFSFSPIETIQQSDLLSKLKKACFPKTYHKVALFLPRLTLKNSMNFTFISIWSPLLPLLEFETQSLLSITKDYPLTVSFISISQLRKLKAYRHLCPKCTAETAFLWFNKILQSS